MFLGRKGSGGDEGVHKVNLLDLQERKKYDGEHSLPNFSQERAIALERRVQAPRTFELIECGPGIHHYW